MKWTDEEIEKAKALYASGKSHKEVSEALGRSEGSVKTKMHLLDIRPKRVFTEKEKEYVLTYYKRFSDTELGNRLGRSNHSIRSFRKRNGIEDRIECMDGFLTTAEVSRVLGITDTTILRKWIRKHGLKCRVIGRNRFVKDVDLFDFMQKHTDFWNPERCEDWYFEDFKWYQDIKKEYWDKKIKERWGEWL